MKNINTKEYWDNRFSSGDWKSTGKQQTREYAKANVSNLTLGKEFNGTILDFGCALGDAIPIYHSAFPEARLIGVDISESAVEKCKNRYGQFADFKAATHFEIPEADVIIASHVMEHLTDDTSIVKEILNKCSDLFVFVPFQESPLYFEHVNCYDTEYYAGVDGFADYKVFKVQYTAQHDLIECVKSIIKLKFKFSSHFSKDIIMFHFTGKLNK